MDQEVSARRIADKVFAKPGISRHDGRAPAIVDAKAERGLDEIAVVDFEGSDFHAIAVVDNAFLDFGYGNRDVLLSQLLVGDTGSDVPLVGLLQVVHHIPGACRPEYLECPLTLGKGSFQPAREPEVGDADDMIGMKVRDEELIG